MSRLSLICWSRISFAFFISALPSFVGASYLPEWHTPLPIGMVQNRWEQYVLPNELDPQKARSIWSQSISGVYVSVGTERGFVGAAVSDATHLVLTDIIPSVVFFNRMNIALLKISNNRDDYLFLRLRATYEDWLKRLPRFLQIGDSEDELSLLADKSAWRWWNARVRGIIDTSLNSKESELYKTRWNISMSMVHAQPSSAFQNVNYLYDDVLFERLHAMALSNRLGAYLLDLRDIEKVTGLLRSIQARGQEISVFDMSNAWWDNFTKFVERRNLFRQLGNAHPLGILLMTHSQDGKGAVGVKVVPEWVYFGIRFESLASHDAATTAAGDLPKFQIKLGTSQPLIRRLNGLVFPKDRKAFSCATALSAMYSAPPNGQ